MRRQKNVYTIEGDVAQLACVDNSDVTHLVVFPAEYVSIVRGSHWAYKGKNGIVNSFGTSIASIFAELYGFAKNTWKRIEPNEDHFKRNYTLKFVPEYVGLIPKTIIDHSDEYFERVRWTSKYKCELLEVVVLRYGVPHGSIKILVNTYLRTAIPKYCKLKETATGVEILCLNGEPLRTEILKAAMGSDDVKEFNRETFRPDVLDFRIDPNDNTYVSTNTSHIRVHRVDEGALLEVRERIDRTSKERWVRTEGRTDNRFRVPVVPTMYEDRAFFVLVDDEVAERINDLWYNAMRDEVIVDDLVTAEARPLKYLVCDTMNIEYKNVYFAPRLTKRYLKATAHQESPKHRRRAAKIENAIDNKLHMYTKPSYIKHVRMKFNTVGFNTTIYGGVGVYYIDCRADALHRAIKTDDPTLRKDTRGASSMHDPKLPELTGGGI